MRCKLPLAKSTVRCSGEKVSSEGKSTGGSTVALPMMSPKPGFMESCIAPVGPLSFAFFKAGLPSTYKVSAVIFRFHTCGLAEDNL